MTVVGSSNPDGLVVQKRLFARGGLPMKFDIECFAGLVDKGVGVDTEAIHMPVILRDTNVIE